MTEDADWIKQERDHEYRMAKVKHADDEDRRSHRTARIIAWAWAVGIVGVLALIIGTALYVWHDSTERGLQERLACTEAGGAWTSIGRGSPVCIRMEEVTP